jgi:O-antigen/teichoic acid export membrane protein
MLQTLWASYVIQALNVLSGLILARELAPSDRGLVAKIVLYPTLVAALASLGLFDAVTVFIGKGSDARQVVGSATLLLSVSTVGAVIVTAVLVHGLIPHQDSRLADLYLSYIPLLFITLLGSAVLQGQGAFKRYNRSRVSVQLITVIGLGALFVLHRVDVRTILLTYLLAELATGAQAWCYARKSRPGHLLGDFDLTRRILNFGLRAQTSSLGVLLNERGDQLVMALLLPTRELGLYVVAVSVISPVSIVGPSVASIVLVRSSQENRGVRRSVMFTAVATAVLGVGVGALTPLLVNALIPRYGSITLTVILLACGSVPLACNKVYEAHLKATGHTGSAGAAETIGLTAGLLTLTLLASPLGEVGAAVASIVGYLTASLSLLFVRSKFRKSVKGELHSA